MEQATAREAPLRHDERPRRITLVALLIAFLLLVGGLVSAGRYYAHCKSGGDDQRPVTFTVADGDTGTEVVDRLAADGVINCGGLVGRMLLQNTGLASSIRAGTYRLTTGMTLEQALAVLTSPPPEVPTITATIPEGYRLTQIASVYAHELKIPAPRFLARARSGNYTLPPYLPAGTRSLEGFLFPDTYEFAKHGTTADDVIRKMLDGFSTEASGLPFANASKLDVTPYQVVIIASMIEREARVAKDRPLIAAVIYNRLRVGMKLGIDATLLYDDPTPDGELSDADLASHSPYNTRLYAGLPPTPIASPGRASLLAALEPAHSSYLYYVLCGADGHHAFSSTYDQFLQDKARCLG